jgi:hypothetical protein
MYHMSSQTSATIQFSIGGREIRMMVADVLSNVCAFMGAREHSFYQEYFSATEERRQLLPLAEIM